MQPNPTTAKDIRSDSFVLLIVVLRGPELWKCLTTSSGNDPWTPMMMTETIARHWTARSSKTPRGLLRRLPCGHRIPQIWSLPRPSKATSGIHNIWISRQRSQSLTTRAKKKLRYSTRRQDQIPTISSSSLIQSSVPSLLSIALPVSRHQVSTML